MHLRSDKESCCAFSRTVILWVVAWKGAALTVSENAVTVIIVERQ